MKPFLPQVLEPFLESGESDLYTIPVKFQTDKGHSVELSTVYQDTHPTVFPPTKEMQQRPTVVFVHGSPGSHKDFKYMVLPLRERGVRSIAFNWPGMGYTTFDHRLQLTNSERTAFARSLIDRLLPSFTELIFVGHSRGGENALRLARKD
uniref:AB hydrolase-1 domain-containing protein n=1 Tax=Globodera pallida TaxID=36090 RepID=A0A183C3R9_GLOPA